MHKVQLAVLFSPLSEALLAFQAEAGLGQVAGGLSRTAKPLSWQRSRARRQTFPSAGSSGGCAEHERGRGLTNKGEHLGAGRMCFKSIFTHIFDTRQKIVKKPRSTEEENHIRSLRHL